MFLEILKLLGIPALLCSTVFAYCHATLRKTIAETRAIKAGMQAVLRSQMISDYNKWTERGFAPIYARQNFENCWKQYHALGVNGVMDDIHNKFLALPTEVQDHETIGTEK